MTVVRFPRPARTEWTPWGTLPAADATHDNPAASPEASAASPSPRGIVAVLRAIEGNTEDTLRDEWRAHLARQFVPEEPVDLTPPPMRAADHVREYLHSFKRAPSDPIDKVLFYFVMAVAAVASVQVIVTMARLWAVLP
jgi:hypothetical protein